MSQPINEHTLRQILTDLTTAQLALDQAERKCPASPLLLLICTVKRGVDALVATVKEMK